MDRSYSYTRRLARRTALQKRLAAVAAAGVVGCAALYALTAPAPGPATAAAQSAPATLATAALLGSAQEEVLKPGQRRVYPYSIVPGGVSGARELGRVIREDKVVAAHYAEFDMARAHETTVTTPRAVHVSYRKGDKVYWTAKKVMLAEGETLVSDGNIEARARCANQISDTPRFPVEAHGPSAEELDSSVVENDPAAGGLENVSMAMLEGEGAPGGFLHAPGTGSAGGILAGGAAHESASLFAATANVPGASSGAILSSRSGSSRAAPGKGAEESPAGGSDGGSGSGAIGGGTPTESNPSTDTPGTSAPGTPSTPSPQPVTPQPSTPGTTPGDGGSPGSPGTTPSRPDVPTPALPDGGQSGGGESGTPSQPPAEIGGNPSPGGPDDSPVPEPSLEPPKEPVQPGQQPAKPVEVPEPGSLWLLAPGLALLLVLRRRKRRA